MAENLSSLSFCGNVRSKTGCSNRDGASDYCRRRYSGKCILVMGVLCKEFEHSRQAEQNIHYTCDIF